ncbi:OLC1v1035103C2 [Oldenlandia corymbosa var. corymbosa]|nr:OLC1v1035103C2 [Oldenlandia corymbosa var. corymbosa]
MGNSSSKMSSAMFFFLGGIVLLVIVLLLFLIIKKVLRTRKDKMSIPTQVVMSPGGTSRWFSGHLRTISYFDFQTLKKATKNFHSSNVLGRGGFGPVYLGKLDDGRMVAVKQLSVNKSQQGESEFLSEVRMITSIQHKNLVRLIGCCSDGEQRLLVYEYMKNRSLDLIVYGKTETYLNWSTRFQIIIGVARGLQYLHEDSHVRIVHRDIKASNILLNEKFQPRIGDFGLARFFPEDQAYLSTTFAGTLGYTAPEYALRGELSEKADIYSFGVLVLEIISCRKNTDLTLPSEMQYLPEYAWKLYEKSRLIDLLDPRLCKEGVVEKDVLTVLHVALLCIQPHGSLRPPMSAVVALLTHKSESNGAPVRPAFLGRKRRPDEVPSRETVSEVLSSPPRSDSASFYQQSLSVLPSPQRSSSASFNKQHSIPALPSPQWSDSATFYRQQTPVLPSPKRTNSASFYQQAAIPIPVLPSPQRSHDSSSFARM